MYFLCDGNRIFKYYLDDCQASTGILLYLSFSVVTYSFSVFFFFNANSFVIRCSPICLFLNGVNVTD
jgi:hypothetical protein